ncbi:MAG: hypothetical protein RBR97_07145 [Bacteroidales bacterium]|nr:hypothetical protein [Bacteroidales bacterium]
MIRETSSLISIETIKAIIKKELGINLYQRKVYPTHYHSKSLNHSVMKSGSCWFISLQKETKSGVDLELVNHSVKTEKELLDLIKKFKKVRKMI